MKKTISIIMFIISSQIFSMELSLEDSVNKAYENNKSLKTRQIETIQQKLLYKEAYKDGIPTVSIDIDYTGNEEGKEDTESYFENGITVSQTLFSGGSIYYGAKGAKKKIDLYKIMYQKDMTDTRLKVVKEYVKILQLEKTLEVYKASQKERKEELKMQKVFYDLGLIDKSEILKVESSLYETQSDILEAGNSISTEKIALKKIMGISLKENIKLKDITTSILSPEDIQVEMDKKIALKESLEIKQQKLNLDIKKLEQKVSRSDFFPEIDLDYTYESPEEASFSKASQGDDWEWTVGISFEWDIFNFGSSMDSYERKKLETEKVSILVEDRKEELEQNIITYYLNMKTLYNLIDTKEKYYETLKETYEIDKEKYANRLIDTVDYLQTESDLREAEVEYINSQLDYYLAYEEYLNIIK